MIRGPQEYVPSVELEVVNKQKAIPLDENEGIYVRDIKTGKVYTCTELVFTCLSALPCIPGFELSRLSCPGSSVGRVSWVYIFAFACLSCIHDFVHDIYCSTPLCHRTSSFYPPSLPPSLPPLLPPSLPLSLQVRSVCGSTYMLTHDEELWEKNLPPAVEDLLSQAKDPLADRSDRCKRGRE